MLQACAQWGWHLLVVQSDYATPMLTSHSIPPPHRFLKLEKQDKTLSSGCGLSFSAYASKNHWPIAGGQHGRNLSAKIGRDEFWLQGFLTCSLISMSKKSSLGSALLPTPLLHAAE